MVKVGKERKKNDLAKGRKRNRKRQEDRTKRKRDCTEFMTRRSVSVVLIM